MPPYSLQLSHDRDFPGGLVAKIPLLRSWTRSHTAAGSLHATAKGSQVPKQRSKILHTATKTWCSQIFFLKNQTYIFREQTNGCQRQGRWGKKWVKRSQNAEKFPVEGHSEKDWVYFKGRKDSGWNVIKRGAV